MIDYTDPFRNDGVHDIVQSNGHLPNLERITPQVHAVAARLGKKLSRMIVDLAALKPESAIVAPHPSIVALDLLIVTLSRPAFNLERMDAAPPDVAMAEYVRIATHISRQHAMFPTDITLVFDAPR